MHMTELGEHGRGIFIREGDRFVIPEGFIKIALNPLKSTGRLFKPGLDMMATNLFLEGLYQNEETYAQAAAEMERQTDEIVNALGAVAGLDVNNPADSEKILSILHDSHRNTREFWALWTGQFLAIARDARKEGNIERAMWASACAERFRALMIFKTALEEFVCTVPGLCCPARVHQGQSLRRGHEARSYGSALRRLCVLRRIVAGSDSD